MQRDMAVALVAQGWQTMEGMLQEQVEGEVSIILGGAGRLAKARN